MQGIGFCLKRSTRNDEDFFPAGGAFLFFNRRAGVE